jgi:hypothetical protein
MRRASKVGFYALGSYFRSVIALLYPGNILLLDSVLGESDCSKQESTGVVIFLPIAG